MTARPVPPLPPSPPRSLPCSKAGGEESRRAVSPPSHTPEPSRPSVWEPAPPRTAATEIEATAESVSKLLSLMALGIDDERIKVIMRMSDAEYDSLTASEHFQLRKKLMLTQWATGESSPITLRAEQAVLQLLPALYEKASDGTSKDAADAIKTLTELMKTKAPSSQPLSIQNKVAFVYPSGIDGVSGEKDKTSSLLLEKA